MTQTGKLVKGIKNIEKILKDGEEGRCLAKIYKKICGQLVFFLNYIKLGSKDDGLF